METSTVKGDLPSLCPWGGTQLATHLLHFLRKIPGMLSHPLAGEQTELHMADVQILLAVCFCCLYLNWVRPYFPLTTQQLSPLFDALQGHTDPADVISDSPSLQQALQSIAHTFTTVVVD